MSTATAFLDKLAIPHQLFRHASRPTSLEQAAEERGQKPEQIVRSILFRLPGALFVMVLMPGPNQISWKKLREYLGTRKITMATPEEVQQVTGYEIGAVTPFGISSPLRYLIDQRIFNHDEISLGSGEHGVAIILASASLLTAIPGAEISLFCEEFN